MIDFAKFNPEILKRKQYILVVVVVISLLGLVTTVVLLDSNNTQKVAAQTKSGQRIEVSKLAGGLKAEDRWLQKAEQELKELREKLAHQQNETEQLEQKLQAQTDEMKQKSLNQDENGNLDELVAELARLREELDSLKTRDRSIISPDPFANALGIQNTEIIAPNKIHNHELKLDDESSAPIKSYDLKHYIPAGSYVSAVIISGVDASVGINSQSEPRPVLFRITGKAKSATNEKILQEIDIEGCVVTGAASGDLSSERVFVRLLKMTCSKESGRAFETQVHGYVAGLGKAGVRGDVVSREGDFVFKSFLAGIASSAGNGISQRFASPLALPSGLATERPQASDIASSSLGSGIASSSNRLSDYLIQRAEQYQPVISVQAGVDVELVFNDGVYLNGFGGTNAQSKSN